MKSINYLIFCYVLGIILSCSGVAGENVSLTEAKLEAYLKAYKELKEKGPDFLSQVNTGELNSQKQGYEEFEDVLQKNGLTFTEFVKLNAKIGAIYSIAQAEDFMKKMEGLQEWGQQSIDEGVAEIQKALDDPDVPEDTKEELRKTMEELKAQKETMTGSYQHNEKWAKLVLEKVNKITNQKASEQEIELVKKYLDEITEVYTGGVMPTNFKVQ